MSFEYHGSKPILVTYCEVFIDPSRGRVRGPERMLQLNAGGSTTVWVDRHLIEIINTEAMARPKGGDSHYDHSPQG